MTLAEILSDPDARFTVEGWRGIAFYATGPERLSDEDYEWTGIKYATGNVLMVMVGDDTEHVVDPDDVTLLPDNAYCPECGQIGCTATRAGDDYYGNQFS